MECSALQLLLFIMLGSTGYKHWALCTWQVLPHGQTVVVCASSGGGLTVPTQRELLAGEGAQ